MFARLFQPGRELIKEHRRAYVIINAAYYGLVLCLMVYGLFNRELNQKLLELVGTGFSQGFLAPVAGAYIGGKVLAAIGLTFVTNLLVGSFATITLPGLIIPFSGMLMGAYRAVLWGLLFSPPLDDLSPLKLLAGLLILILLLLEGQAYVLTLLGVYVQGRAFLFPERVGAAGHWAGYKLGLKQTLSIYVWVAAVLVVAAIYEALMAILALPGLV